MTFFMIDSQDVTLLRHAYRPSLVVLSFLLAFGGSILALYVARSVAASTDQKARQILIAAGAGAFGLAVWSMHFIGMLSFELCTGVSYDPLRTFLSVVPAVLAAWVALHWISQPRLSASRRIQGGIIVGAGIGLMHYMGMSAMQMHAALRFDPVLFALSLLVAVALATLSISSRQLLSGRTGIDRRVADIVSAAILAAAITSMHYTGMAAARFVGTPEMDVPAPPEDWYFLTLLVTLGITSITGAVASGVLVTRMKELVVKLRLHESELETIIHNSTEGIIATRDDGTINIANRTFERLFGCEPADVVGRHFSAFLPQWSIPLHDQPDQISRETPGRRGDGSLFPVRVVWRRIKTDGLVSYLGFLADISDVKRTQDKLLYEASHDFLTGLLNRRFFEEQLRREVARSRRSGSPLALVLLDIDHFKAINDNNGHLVGDQMLNLLATRLKSLCRSGDVVARYGGEEFILLLPDTSRQNAEVFAERARAEIEKMVVHCDQRAVRCTVSLGIACSHNTEVPDPDLFVQQVDAAMYRAKGLGRNCVVAVDV